MKCKEVNAREQNEWIVKRDFNNEKTKDEKNSEKTERVRGRESENDEEREKEAQIG